LDNAHDLNGVVSARDRATLSFDGNRFGRGSRLR
jgi:hypothetical protein